MSLAAVTEVSSVRDCGANAPRRKELENGPACGRSSWGVFLVSIGFGKLGWFTDGGQFLTMRLNASRWCLETVVNGSADSPKHATPEQLDAR